jgi:DNA-binding transcriptional LysR family regulator
MTKDLEFEQFQKILLHKYYIFDCIVRYKSASKAARHLGVPAFKVQNDLKSIEKSLGCELYVRNKKDFVLTLEGEKLAQFSKKMVEEFEPLRQATEPKEEELIISAYHGIAEKILPQALMKFSHLHPHVHLKVLTGIEYADFTDNNLDILLAGHLTNRADLQAVHIITESYCLYATPEYLERYGTPRSPEDLLNHKMILFRGIDYTPKEIFEKIEPMIVSTSMGFIYQLTKLGHGISFLPISRLTEEDISAKKIIRILDGQILHNLSAYFLAKRFSSKAPLVNDFFECLKDIEELL